jgi:hypothetical protein
VSVLGLLLFQPSESVQARKILTLAYGVIGSAVLYVNLAAFHIKALDSELTSQASAAFITSFYGAAAFGGLVFGALAARSGWLLAGKAEISLLSGIAGIAALALRF